MKKIILFVCSVCFASALLAGCGESDNTVKSDPQHTSDTVKGSQTNVGSDTGK